MGKIIENINKKAEKGIKIGEKTIFSNYKGVKEHSLNFNNKNNNKINTNTANNENFMINQSIQLSIKQENNDYNNNKMKEIMIIIIIK